MGKEWGGGGGRAATMIVSGRSAEEGGMFATVIVVGQAEGKFKRPSSEHCWLDQALVLLSLPFDEL